jgi:purine-binding chemotaxis protein CheW
VVREIIPYRAATRLPGAPAYVRGLINLRGTLVTVVDLGVRLRPDRTPAQDGSIIIVAVDNHVAGLAVDEVMDVRLVRPESTQGEGESIVRNLGHLEGTVVILVDVPVLVREVLV